MPRLSILIFTVCFSIAAYSIVATADDNPGIETATAQSSPATSITQVLAKAGIWEKDFPNLLAFMETWNRINEPKIYVFPDRVVGGTRYAKREEAQAAATRLADAMKVRRSTPNAQAADLLRGASAQAATQLRVEVIKFLPDDDDYHVAWVNPTLRFITPGVSMSAVRNSLGAPEQSTVELVQNEAERRPVILTLHRYAGGSIVFAESDWSAVPGIVDRVILDVKAVTAALY